MTALILLDFAGRRPEASLDQLELDRAGVDCQPLLEQSTPDSVDAPSYAKALMLASDPDRPIDGIVAYCAASPLAVAVSHLTGAPVVFLDPAASEEQDIVGKYAEIVRQIDGSGPTTRTSPLIDIASKLAEPAKLITAIRRDLSLRATRSLQRDGFGAAETAAAMSHTVGVYVRWLTFLVAMHHDEQPPLARPALRVLSRDHPAKTPLLGIEKAPAVRVDCTRADLARHASTRAAVLEFFHVTTSRSPKG
ncbi:MAG TPA: hypothetical protein VFG35_30625 [Actinoplanes sp.]|nr:hypothetical protein [Actinoplanes sp.]